jgi:hypothetical protein
LVTLFVLHLFSAVAVTHLVLSVQSSLVRWSTADDFTDDHSPGTLALSSWQRCMTLNGGHAARCFPAARPVFYFSQLTKPVPAFSGAPRSRRFSSPLHPSSVFDVTLTRRQVFDGDFVCSATVVAPPLFDRARLTTLLVTT